MTVLIVLAAAALVLLVLLVFGLCRVAGRADEALDEFARQRDERRMGRAGEGEALDFKWPERRR